MTVLHQGKLLAEGSMESRTTSGKDVYLGTERDRKLSQATAMDEGFTGLTGCTSRLPGNSTRSSPRRRGSRRAEYLGSASAGTKPDLLESAPDA
jgi:hypothetical protein